MFVENAFDLIKEDVKNYQNLEQKSKEDPELLKTMLNIEPESIQYISDETFMKLQRDELFNVIKTALDKDYSLVWFISDKIIGRIIFRIAECYPDAIKYINVNNTTCAHSEMVFYKILSSGDGMALRYLPKECIGKKSYIKAALHLNGYPFQFASLKIKNDKEFVLNHVVNRYGYVLNYVSDELRNDKDVVKAAVSSMTCNRWVFSYASDALRSDKEFIKEIISISPGSIRYICNDLKNDESFLRELIEINKYVKNYMDLSWIKIRKEIESIRTNDLVISPNYSESKLVIKAKPKQLVIIPKLPSVTELVIKDINHGITIDLINRLPNLKKIYTNSESKSFREDIEVVNIDKHVERIKQEYEEKIKNLEEMMEKEINNLNNH